MIKWVEWEGERPGRGERVATATREGPAEPAGLGERRDDVVGTKGQREARRDESRGAKQKSNYGNTPNY
jgi:hypothetical protein